LGGVGDGGWIGGGGIAIETGSAGTGRVVPGPAPGAARGMSGPGLSPPVKATGLSPRLSGAFGWSMDTGGIGASFGSFSPSPLTARATTGASARDIAASISRSAPISAGLPACFSPRSSDVDFSSTRRGLSVSLMILLPLC
jgi:hypothetical protein